MSEHLFDQIEKMISMEARVAWDILGVEVPLESPFVNAKTMVQEQVSYGSKLFSVYVEGRLVAVWSVIEFKLYVRTINAPTIVDDDDNETCGAFRRRVPNGGSVGDPVAVAMASCDGEGVPRVARTIGA